MASRRSRHRAKARYQVHLTAPRFSGTMMPDWSGQAGRDPPCTDTGLGVGRTRIVPGQQTATGIGVGAHRYLEHVRFHTALLMKFQATDARSKNNYQELLEVFPKGRWVSFIGGGPSQPTGIGDWSKLLEELIQFKGLGLSVDKYDGTLPQLASEIYSRYNALDCAEDFYEVVLSKTTPTETHATLFHHELIKTIRVHVTTNFDNVLDLAYDKYMDRPPAQRQCLPDFDPELLVDDSIVYLHANREEKRFVFRAEDFDFYYPSVSHQNGSTSVESLLRHIYLQHQLLFIGCSFEDGYLRGALSAMWSKLTYERAREQELFGPRQPINSPCHFALLSPLKLDRDAEKRERREYARSQIIRQLEKSGVRTIVCTEHCDIETVLEDLQQTTVVVTPGDEPPDAV